jgi:hypothetical protein
MEPICALGSLGSAKGGGSGILPSTISTYHEKIWLLAHPGGCGFRFSIGEKIDYLMGLQIHEDRAEPIAASKREIVDAQKED